jgi:hypothetical protein
MCLQGLSDSDFCKFMQYSSRFFFSNGKLCCHDTHRRHKIAVLKEKRYELLKEVYDILGHKKIYAMQMQLLEQFWWPFLDQDVKWFVQTCHQCQVCQMRYHYILLTVATPASVRGHPSISLLPLSSPTLHLFICIHPPHLCTILKDHTHSRRLPGPMVRRLS